MGVFDKVLASDESIFKNEVALNYDYIPKIVPHRKAQQEKVAYCIKPLFQNMNGRNIVISGLPGIGKTVATKHVVNEIEEHTDDIIPIYINCWQKNTPYKIYLEICEQLDFKFTQNKRTEELLQVIKKLFTSKSAVFIFDEIDKADDASFIYSLLEEIYYKTIICITNYKSWMSTLDKRIMSRLVPETLEFLPYNKAETKDIIEKRIEIAFYPNTWEEKAIEMIIEKTSEIKDIRTGLYLIKESGLSAEDRSSKKVEEKDVEVALKKVIDFKIKDVNELEDDSQKILNLIKNNSPARIGDIFKLYEEADGKLSYKSFQRRVMKLEESKFIQTKKQMGGAEGTTTMLHYNTTNKQLTDF